MICIFEDLYSKIHDVTFWLENAEEIFQATLRGLDADAKARQRRMLNAQKKYINKKNKKRKKLPLPPIKTYSLNNSLL